MHCANGTPDERARAGVRSNGSGPALDSLILSRNLTANRHVVGNYRLRETLEGERANLFGGDASLQRGIDALTEQNLAVLCLSAETSGDIAHRADRGVAGALREADLTERRVSLRNTGAEAQIAATLVPVGDQR